VPPLPFTLIAAAAAPAIINAAKIRRSTFIAAERSGEPRGGTVRVQDVAVSVVVGFDECFRLHYPRLVALGVAMSGSAEVARELAQETMIRAHARWDELQTYERPEAWLRRVMSNLLIDHHRSRAAERAAFTRLQARPIAYAPGEHDVPEWHTLIASLPARQRMIVTLYYAEDLPIDEIATMLDVANGTVKSALAKARDRLHRTLTEEGRDGRAN
jgi:RNA polymerase sigma factor (sigma-70 family)